MVRHIFAMGLLVVPMLLGGCHSSAVRQEEGTPPAEEVVSNAAPAVDSSSFPAPSNGESQVAVSTGEESLVPAPVPQLSPGLVLSVRVLVAGKKEIDEPNKRIANAGELSLPLVGNVMASGLTLDQLSERLTKLYTEYFIDPQVVVEFVKDQDSDLVSPWGYVTVLGRVKNPGRVSIPPTQDLTVSGAIQKAGGLDTSAKDTSIRVTRQLSDGRSRQFDVDLRKVGSTGQVRDDLILKPGDVVFVPEMMF